ncbi:MAG: AAA family ATPase [Bacteroidetes bacterium GWF2_49_14]|nr:MAG: AAA family ATPase [Bacteroidetes bacterium GWF2_49_14]
MEKQFEYSASRINSVDLSYKRYLWNRINWDNRLIAIIGARGVGKTTFLLQYIRENLNTKPDEVIYVNMDDLYFSKTALVDFADNFVKRGGKYLFLDEVHKYKNWSQEIKNSYDYFPDLKLVVTGSSALDIYRGKFDLSRRAILYRMSGLSFREFIGIKYNIHFPVLELDDLLNHASEKILPVLEKIKPLKLFEEYLINGYYPFFLEGESDFQTRLKQTINQVLDSDLPSIENIDFGAVHSLRKLISILAEIVPYKPNIVKLSQQVGVSRETLLRYLHLLEKAELLILMQSGTKGMSKMNKPDKIFLNNPNLVSTLADGNSNHGTLRETYFINQLQVGHSITGSDQGDFLVDHKYTFEIGGKNKTRKQISGIKDAWIAADNVEYARQDKIPLWLFGFLY